MADGKDKDGFSPGKLHWYVTTTIASLGAIIASVSLFMNFFYHPAPPPVTVTSKHSDFMDLAYSDRLVLCVLYIKENIQRRMDEWVERTKPMFQPQPSVRPTINDPDAGAQQIVNLHTALEDYAQKRAPYDEGLNLQSCSLTPHVGNGAQVTTPTLERDTGSGNAQPRADLVVVKESPIYNQGTFAGIEARGRQSRVIEAAAFPGTPDERRIQLGYSLVGGRDEDTMLWASTVWLNEDDVEEWVPNIEEFRGYR